MRSVVEFVVNWLSASFGSFAKCFGKLPVEQTEEIFEELAHQDAPRRAA